MTGGGWGVRKITKNVTLCDRGRGGPKDDKKCHTFSYSQVAGELELQNRFFSFWECAGKCCQPFRSDLLRLLPDRFLPPRVVIKNDSRKITLDDESDNRSEFAGLFLNLQLKLLRSDAPYDYCAPSARNKLAGRTCPACMLSFPSTLRCCATAGPCTSGLALASQMSGNSNSRAPRKMCPE